MISHNDLINSLAEGNAKPFNNHAFLIVAPYSSSVTFQHQLELKCESKIVVIMIDGSSDVDRMRLLHESLSRGEISLRIVMIDHAHMLRVASANALLKIIEEPPHNVLFVLTAPSCHHVLPTLRSRCLPIRFIEDTSFDVQRNESLHVIEQLRTIGYAERLLDQNEWSDEMLVAHANALRAAMYSRKEIDSPTPLLLWYDALMVLARAPGNQRTVALKTALLSSILPRI